MGAVAGIAAIAGGGMNMFGEYAEGRHKEAVLRQNAKLAELQALDAIERGQAEETNYRKQIKQMIGSQRTSYAAQGVAIDSGTPLEIQAQTAAIGEEDALTIRNNAAREAWGYRVQASNMRAQAKQVKRGTNMNAAGSLLTLGSKSYSLYKSMSDGGDGAGE